MRRVLVLVLVAIVASITSFAQVDTAFIYNNSMPYGSLDIRIAKSATNYYYLKENETFSFRESAPGVKTGTYLDMTVWDSSPFLQGHLREKTGAADNFVMNYRLLMPDGYNAGYSPGYPIIIILHGLGERGNCWDNSCYHADKNYTPITNSPPAPTTTTHELLNNDHQLTNGGSIHLLARNAAGSKLPDDPGLSSRAFPGFVLMPQNLNGWDIGPAQDVIRIIRLLTKKYNIDENRIYIHGLSNGGQGVYETIKRAPWMFAAALTMSPINDANINMQKVTSSIAHIPLWVFQGGQDINPYPKRTENMIKQFRDAGAVVRYTLYPNLGHGTWNTAYNEPDFFTWMLGKNRGDVQVFAGNAMVCGSEGLSLRVPEGFFAYQWQKDGQTISSANTATYVATSPGKYRARFSRVSNPSEGQWNPWSAEIVVTAGEAPQTPVVKQHGTVVLKDLNNYGDARLESENAYNHYYWYKDGSLLDFPGDQDDTLRLAVIKPGMGKGAYTLVVSDYVNCPSPPSQPKHVFFNNEAPVNIEAPSGLAGTVTGPDVNLTWTDASNNEGGFEIWRRRKIDATTFAPWQMATLTTANVKAFKDTGLNPTTTYQYRIRAVSSTGRSDYASGNLELVTGKDEEPPTAPANLVATRIGVQKVKLTWRSATDNTTLRDYQVTFGGESLNTNSADTTFILTNLPLNALIDFTVKARDIAGNLSEPSNTTTSSTYISGLFYQHSTGYVPDLDSIDWTSPEFTGMTLTFTLEPKTQEDYFNFRFDGYLLITNPGAYQFRTTSDDGSRLWLKNVAIVHNDGIHNLKTVTSTAQNLTKGAHRITVDFFDYMETDSLGVQYKGPDTNNQWANFTVDVLKSAEEIVTAIPPQETDLPFTLSIFPNPARASEITIRVESSKHAPVGIKLIDPTGRVLRADVFDPDVIGSGVHLSPDSHLPEGIYFIHATQDRQVTRRRVIIRNR